MSAAATTPRVAAPPQAAPPSRGSMIDSCVSRFRELGINLLAVDFDQTILDIHTGGRWTGTVAELAEHVRSEFKWLLQACCEHDIQVAVVTFSGQTALVQGVVETIVGPDYLATHVAVRGRDRSWSYRGVGSQEGKQAFIASAAEELEHKGAARRRTAAIATGDEDEDGAETAAPLPDDAGRISKNTTVLIDDDAMNIKCAIEDGTRAVWFNPNKPHHILKELARLV